MAKIFLSYGRKAATDVEGLVEDLEELGHAVWFDQDANGGVDWWDRILAEIRGCDLFVLVLTRQALDSRACQEEWRYAAAVGKTILPVMVADVSPNLLPFDLAQINYVDYRDRDRAALFRFARAVNGAPAPKPLPDPLPKAPAVPISEISRVGHEIRGSVPLDSAAQSRLLAEFGRLLRDPETASDARELLRDFRKRHDTLASTAEILAILEDATAANEARPRKEVEPQTNARAESDLTNDVAVNHGPETNTPPDGRTTPQRQFAVIAFVVIGLVIVFGVVDRLGWFRSPAPSLEPVAAAEVSTPTVAIRYHGNINSARLIDPLRSALESVGYSATSDRDESTKASVVEYFSPADQATAEMLRDVVARNFGDAKCPLEPELEATYRPGGPGAAQFVIRIYENCQ